MNRFRTGLAAALGSFFLWGLLPLYWKQLDSTTPWEILTHRIIWSFVFMTAFLAWRKRLPGLANLLGCLASDKKKGASVCAAALLITANWCIFIWAVVNDHIVDTSVGYYINPLMSVFLGVLLFHERLTRLQWVSIALAAAGIGYMALQLGKLPLVAVGLALTFSLYGAVKKGLAIDAWYSITLETLVVFPFALMYGLYLFYTGEGHFGLALKDTALLIGAGIVTALPLVLFSAGANGLPLSVLGFCQYLSPTLSLLLGVLVYHEPFSETEQATFAMIWLAVILFSFAGWRRR
ncbi:MAG: EamA family transporter RarD [Dialister sp.]|nr:EamA family transporter RarD [Dialister sp.]